MGGWLCGLHFNCGICGPAPSPSVPVFPSFRSWAFLLDLASFSWWPHLSCSWPLHLYFAASANAVKATTTHCPPRGRRDVGPRPRPRKAWLSPLPITRLTQHRSCLMCPTELHSVTQDAVISGTDVRTFVETPGGGTGKAGPGWVGHVPTESVSAALTRGCCAETGQFSPCGGLTHRPSLAKCCPSPPWPRGWRLVAERSLPRIAALQTESGDCSLRKALLRRLFLSRTAFRKTLFRKIFVFFFSN